MAKRKVTITTTRTYHKTSTIEVEVDENIKGDELQEFLVVDDDIDDQIEDSIGSAVLKEGETEYNYQDPTNNDGGNL